MWEDGGGRGGSSKWFSRKNMTLQELKGLEHSVVRGSPASQQPTLPQNRYMALLESIFLHGAKNAKP